MRKEGEDCMSEESKRSISVKLLLEGKKEFVEDLSGAADAMKLIGSEAKAAADSVTQLNNALQELAKLRKQLL